MGGSVAVWLVSIALVVVLVVLWFAFGASRDPFEPPSTTLAGDAVGQGGGGGGSERPFRLRIEGLDYCPEELRTQAPFEARFVRGLRGADAGQYLLFVLDQPLEWKGVLRTHVIVVGRLQGQPVTPSGSQFVINIAIVTDPAVEQSDAFAFSQADFAAVGTAHSVSN